MEAALIMPFFLVFIIAIANIVHVIIVEAALQSAAHETVKQAAAHIYPVYILHQHADIPSIIRPMEEAMDKLPSFLRESLSGGMNDAAKAALLPLVKAYANSRWLDLDRLQVVEAEFPDFSDRTKATFALTIRYEYRMVVPFFAKEWSIEKRAAERVWIGG